VWAAGTGIVLKFPSSATSTSNDAVLTLSSFNDTQINNDGFISYKPTNLAFTLAIGGVKQIDFSLTAAYTGDGSATLLNLSLFLNPFTLTANLTNNATTISETESWSEGVNNIISTNLTLLGDFSALTDPNAAAEKANTISGYIQIADAKFTVNLDEKSRRATPNPSLAQLNQFVKMGLTWSDGAKIADATFGAGPNASPKVMLTFADGSTADADVYFSTAIMNLESFIGSLMSQLQSN
jgi:hypothetical protein